jgi:hypothetical protein
LAQSKKSHACFRPVTAPKWIATANPFVLLLGFGQKISLVPLKFTDTFNVKYIKRFIPEIRHEKRSISSI